MSFLCGVAQNGDILNFLKRVFLIPIWELERLGGIYEQIKERRMQEKYAQDLCDSLLRNITV